MSDTQQPPIIVWFRRDLRVSDNPALFEAAKSGASLLCLFVRDPVVDAMGAAAKWRLGLSLAQFGKDLKALGAELVLRSGHAIDVLSELVDETGVSAIYYNRDYAPETIERDQNVKAELSARITVKSFNSLLLFEPWRVETKTGGFYKVYSPFWRAVCDREVAAPLPAPTSLRSLVRVPKSESLQDWELGKAMNRGADIVAEYTCVGEAAAQNRLEQFISDKAAAYKADRDRLDLDATSGLAENLTYGEISPRQMWHAGQRAHHSGARGAEHFLKEVVWREFAYHLLYHSPHIVSGNWREGWDAFPWLSDNEDAEAWRRGQTGEPVVDAAMRQMYVTGIMHNRARMIVASYLTKHLMVHWKVGMDWFAECLTDWDPASNAMGWQWTAGCGPDAAPFFRIFNPETQAEKFDREGLYRRRFLDPSSTEGAAFFKAAPRSWGLTAGPYDLKRRVELKAGRSRALEAYTKYTEDGRAASA